MPVLLLGSCTAADPREVAMLKLDGAIALAMAAPCVPATTLGVNAAYPECPKWSAYL